MGKITSKRREGVIPVAGLDWGDEGERARGWRRLTLLYFSTFVVDRSTPHLGITHVSFHIEVVRDLQSWKTLFRQIFFFVSEI